MPRHCSAAGCNSRDTREARKAGITFHRLPKRGNPRRATWILNSCRKGPEGKGQWEPQSDYIYFCSKHFTLDSFELSGVSGYHRLKDDAIPTVVDALPHQRRKVSRGRGRPRKVERQRASTDEERPEGKDILIKEDVVQNAVSGEGAKKNSKTASEEQENDKAPPLPGSHDPPADLPPNPPSPRPLSPSCYMRRLPPPLGFYLAKEHSYAQLCPLMWRKRYNKAIDNLEKALRLLSAARRRENRLRLTLLRLRESRFRSTLSRLQDSGQRRENRGGHGGLCSWAPRGSTVARTDRSGNLEGLESEMGSTTEDVELFAEDGWRRPAHAARERITPEEEEGCCFYCGRGREDEEPTDARDGRAFHRAVDLQGDHGRFKPSKTLQGKRGTRRMPSTFRAQKVACTRNNVAAVEAKDCYFYYCEDDLGEEQTKMASMDLHPQQQSPDPEASLELCGKPLQQVSLLPHQTEMLLQMHALPGPRRGTVALSDASSTLRLQQLHLLQPNVGLQLGFLLPDMATKEGSAVQSEQDGGNHVYWVQERADNHVLLVPQAAESRERDGVDVDSQSILVAEDGFQQGSSEEGNVLMGLRNNEMRDSQDGHQSNLRTTVVSGDVRQRLKEHVEGFQLQLSSEFID
ncbi:THAP domain-containing protein 7 [Brachyhypopomus gauderio]|uniref:THAP domain-containing protein 7 n=1 Tax=Brachyhypopomus gauderio TaxID=698409 RepID=UPI004042B6DF